ncbi:hypothetical protein M0811_04717 [Anaeramoeba ignava]|uniref:SCD domain-containing protein n=1 Tax=Anaeramoeba ignava TaxID=1746090 RepID=A0A9Q0LUY4_ANAIG|nr:hypothetical protein M0811_04717 [Anaeramoeba ignava]
MNSKRKKNSHLSSNFLNLNEKSLFQKLLEEKLKTKKIIENWNEINQKNEEKSIINLINLFFESIEIPFQIQNLQINNQNQNQILQEIQQTIPKKYTKPSIFNFYEKNKNKIVIKFGQFWRKITPIIFINKNSFEKISFWIVFLSNSLIKPLRFVSTIAGLEIITKLNKMLIRKSDIKEKTVSLSNYERKRIKVTKKSRNDSNKDTEQIKSNLSQLIELIFQFRYRDSEPLIRCLCLDFLYKWIEINPEQFFQNEYLKYFGWMLNDKCKDVRLKSIHNLSKLYSSDNFVPKLDTFTKRFRSRFIEMINDRSIDVSIASINLLIPLFLHFEISKFEKNTIYSSLFIPNWKIRKEMGKLIQNVVINPKKKNSKNTEENEERIELKIISKSILSKFEKNNHFLFLIDSLWTHSKCLQNWKLILQTITDLNVEEKTQIQVLSEMLYFSFCIYFGESKCLQNDNFSIQDPLITGKNNRKIQKNVLQESSQFYHLLVKFQSDPDIISIILKFIGFLFKYKYHLHKKQLDTLRLILEKFKDIFFIHHEEHFSIPQNIIKIFTEIAENKEHFLSENAEIFLVQIIEKIVSNIKDSVEEIQKKQDRIDEPNLLVLQINLKRFKIVSKTTNFPIIYDEVFQILLHFIQNSNDNLIELNYDISVLLYQCMFYCLMWIFTGLNKKKEENTNPNEKQDLIDIQILIKYKEEFYDLIQDQFISTKDLEMKHKLFRILGRLFILFNHNFLENSNLNQLEILANDEIQNEFMKHFEKMMENEKNSIKTIYSLLKYSSLSIISGSISTTKFPKILQNITIKSENIKKIIKTVFEKICEQQNINSLGRVIIQDTLKSKFKEIEKKKKKKTNQEEKIKEMNDLSKELSSFSFVKNNPQENSSLICNTISFAFTNFPYQLHFFQFLHNFLLQLSINQIATIKDFLQRRKEKLSEKEKIDCENSEYFRNFEDFICEFDINPNLSK